MDEIIEINWPGSSDTPINPSRLTVLELFGVYPIHPIVQYDLVREAPALELHCFYSLKATWLEHDEQLGLRGSDDLRRVRRNIECERFVRDPGSAPEWMTRFIRIMSRVDRCLGSPHSDQRTFVERKILRLSKSPKQDLRGMVRITCESVGVYLPTDDEIGMI